MAVKDGNRRARFSKRRWPAEGRATANLVPDAHLAALAVEHNCTLCSTDADFSRFKSVKWLNPLDTDLASDCR